MPSPFVAAGIVSSRSRRTSCSVARSEGADFGVAVSTAALPESLTSGWVTGRRPPSWPGRRAGRKARVGRRLVGLLALVVGLLFDLLRLRVELGLDLRLGLRLGLRRRHALGLEARGDLLLLVVGLLLGLVLLV